MTTSTPREPLNTAVPVKLFKADGDEIRKICTAAGITYSGMIRIAVHQAIPKLRRMFAKCMPDYVPKKRATSKRLTQKQTAAAA